MAVLREWSESVLATIRHFKRVPLHTSNRCPQKTDPFLTSLYNASLVCLLYGELDRDVSGLYGFAISSWSCR